MNKKTVTFIGAGPGDPELITVKGKIALENADVILYAGSLVNKELLKWAKNDAVLIDTAPLNLDEIITKISDGVNANKKVVRIHSGDSSLYGAIQEQFDRLLELNIDFEVIPGVTAAFALAASLKREFTLPEITQTLIFTRLEGRTPVPVGEDIETYIKSGASVVIYLSAGLIDSLIERLKFFLPDDYPVVVGYKMSYPEEKLIYGNISNILSLMQENNIKNHALIFISPVLMETKREKSKLYDRDFTHGFR